MHEHLNAEFLTTRWTQILGTEDGTSRTATQSSGLIHLCESYHFPVYAFIKNRCGDREQARDLTQGFFEELVEKQIHRQANPDRGRFRTFLLGAVKNFLRKDYRDAHCLKRGGGKLHVSLDKSARDEPGELLQASEITPDALFDHEWAVAVFDRVWNALEMEYEHLNQSMRFQALRPCLTEPDPGVSYAELAKQLGTTEDAIKAAVYRMKGRFRQLFRASVAQIVEDPTMVDDEIRYLIEAAAFTPYHSPS